MRSAGPQKKGPDSELGLGRPRVLPAPPPRAVAGVQTQSIWRALGSREARLTLFLLLGYQVSWEVYGRNGSRLTHTLNSTTREYKIQGLSSLTTYTIDVAAVTAAGAGLATSSTISSGVPPGQ